MKVTLDSNKVLYSQIAEQLKDQIASGKLSPGDKVPGDIELAVQLGVSPGTVRRAFSELVEDGILIRRKKAGTFVKGILSDRTSLTDIGLLVFGLDGGSFQTSLLKGIDKACKKLDLHPNVHTVTEDIIGDDKNKAVQNLIKNDCYRGWIIFSPVASSNLKYLKEKEIPFVVVANDYTSIRVPTVIPNIYGAISTYVSSLLNNGVNNIAIIIWEQWVEKSLEIVRGADQMIWGYLDAVLEARDASAVIPPLVIEKGTETSCNANMLNKIERYLSKIEDLDYILVNDRKLREDVIKLADEKTKVIVMDDIFRVPVEKMGMRSVFILENLVTYGIDEGRICILEVEV